MSNIIRPTAGTVANFTSCGFTATDFNSLAAGGCAVMPTAAAIGQNTNLDDWLIVSFSLTVGGTTVAGSYLGLFLLPENQDNSTYGDGTATNGSAFPGQSYWVTNAQPKVGVASGSAIVGTFPPVFIGGIRRPFILGIGNGLTVALNASAAAAVEYYTTNLNGNG